MACYVLAMQPIFERNEQIVLCTSSEARHWWHHSNSLGFGKFEFVCIFSEGIS